MRHSGCLAGRIAARVSADPTDHERMDRRGCWRCAAKGHCGHEAENNCDALQASPPSGSAQRIRRMRAVYVRSLRRWGPKNRYCQTTVHSQGTSRPTGCTFRRHRRANRYATPLLALSDPLRVDRNDDRGCLGRPRWTGSFSRPCRSGSSTSHRDPGPSGGRGAWCLAPG